MTEHGSGLTLDRPALKAITDAVRNRKVGMILVKNLSRIGRSWDVVQEYIDFLNKHKVSLLCISEGLKTSNHSLSPFSVIKKQSALTGFEIL